jgi:hypothetical protein
MMKKEIQEELINIAPTLIEVGNKNPFRVPSMYFENLEVELKNELDNILKSVPSNYFENLSNRVLAKAKSEKPVRIISLIAKRWIAAASIGLICIASYFTKNTKNIAENQSFALEVELEEAFDYLDALDELNLSEVIGLSQDEILDEMGEDIYDVEIDFFLDEVTLDDLDELL